MHWGSRMRSWTNEKRLHWSRVGIPLHLDLYVEQPKVVVAIQRSARQRLGL